MTACSDRHTGLIVGTGLHTVKGYGQSLELEPRRARAATGVKRPSPRSGEAHKMGLFVGGFLLSPLFLKFL